MNISIFGLGYVGAVSGACLAKMGHSVIGVDKFQLKVDLINQGKSTIVEKNIDDLIAEVVAEGKYQATTNALEAVEKSEIAIICVGTPSNPNGSLDSSYIEKVSREIGSALKDSDKKDYLVILRSTAVPGTVDELVIPVIEKYSSRVHGQGFSVCYNPEFLREGSSVDDFYNPPKIVIGEKNSTSGKLVEKMYSGIKAPVIHTDIRVAEMIKYADNPFHALKVVFANEIGNLCKKYKIDSHELMRIFCLDTKLNISPYYFKPGFAFGGSCLPKDLRALNYQAKSLDLEIPLIKSILESNEYHIQLLIDRLVKFKGKTLGFLGMSFKEGTDDLRESPLVRTIESMIGKGFSIKIYDSNVSISRLVGANRDYINNEIPHISSLMCDTIEELVSESEVIIVGIKDNSFLEKLKTTGKDKTIIDLVKITDDTSAFTCNYEGICW